jgi:organic hydroperoxide reductase OsmC/OhrA
MTDIHYYETTVTWNEGCTGIMSTPGMTDILVATPPEFPKGVPNIWSPEHLLVAAANACLMTTFVAISENSKLQFKSFSSKAVGKLEKVEGKFMISEIELFPQLVVNEVKDIERGIRIIEKSEANCLISRSIKAKIILKPEVKLESI